MIFLVKGAGLPFGGDFKDMGRKQEGQQEGVPQKEMMAMVEL